MTLHRQDLEFERYEVYVKSDLFAERRLVGTCETLADARARAESIVAPLGNRSFKSIDYIGLYKSGREEKFWVQSLDDQTLNGEAVRAGDWIALNGPAKESLEAMIDEVEVQ